MDVDNDPASLPLLLFFFFFGFFFLAEVVVVDASGVGMLVVEVSMGADMGYE